MHDDEDLEFTDDDCLDAARGILLGIVLGACMWAGLGVAIWLA